MMKKVHSHSTFPDITQTFSREKLQYFFAIFCSQFYNKHQENNLSVWQTWVDKISVLNIPAMTSENHVIWGNSHIFNNSYIGIHTYSFFIMKLHLYLISISTTSYIYYRTGRTWGQGAFVRLPIFCRSVTPPQDFQSCLLLCQPAKSTLHDTGSDNSLHVKSTYNSVPTPISLSVLVSDPPNSASARPPPGPLPLLLTRVLATTFLYKWYTP